MKRTLSLKRESLTPLTTDELALLVAAGEGDPQPTPPVFAPTTPLKGCAGTTLDSMVVCSGNCMTHSPSCAC
jgi:hypothetical protein